MSTRTRAGFTLPEALVAGGMFLCIAAAFLFTWSGTRREEELASLHLSMLESAAVAMQQLRTDLREMVVISTAPEVEGTSLRVSQRGDALLLRQGLLGNDASSAFQVVAYDLVPAPTRSGAPRFHLRRTLRSSDGSPLPGPSARDVKVFRTFTLAEASFNYLPPRPGTDRAQGDDHVIHVTFRVVSEGGRAGAADLGGEKTMLLTQVLRFLKPPHPRDFALPLTAAGLEAPPVDVLSTAIAPPALLPALEE